MKSENKLTMAINVLRQSDEDAAMVAVRYLREFLVDNAPTSTFKFNIYDWVAGDDCCPSMTGVFHDPEKQCAVASDGRVLLASPTIYNAAHAGKIIDKYGDEINEPYPRYAKVLASFDAKGHTPSVFLGKEKLAELDKQIAALARLAGDNPSTKTRREFFGIKAFTSGKKSYFLNLRVAFLAATLPECDNWQVNEDGTQFSCVFPDGSRVMLMGLYTDKDEQDKWFVAGGGYGLLAEKMRETEKRMQEEQK